MLSPLITAILPPADSEVWGGSPGKLWRGLFAEQLAEATSKSGGIGIAAIIDGAVADANAGIAVSCPAAVGGADRDGRAGSHVGEGGGRPGDVDERFLRPAPGSSFCEWKGSATYFDVVVGDQVLPRAVWAYPTPSQRFVPITGFVSCYPSTLECTVDGELVTAQEGGFYGGWVTSRVVGPFKGTPGSEWW